jgi:hypothetical protein
MRSARTAGSAARPDVCICGTRPECTELADLVLGVLHRDGFGYQAYRRKLPFTVQVSISIVIPLLGRSKFVVRPKNFVDRSSNEFHI